PLKSRFAFAANCHACGAWFTLARQMQTAAEVLMQQVTRFLTVMTASTSTLSLIRHRPQDIAQFQYWTKHPDHLAPSILLLATQYQFFRANQTAPTATKLLCQVKQTIKI